MSEQHPSPGRNNEVQNRERPSGRSVFCEEENGASGHHLPDAEQFAPDLNRNGWYEEYRKWLLGRQVTESMIKFRTIPEIEAAGLASKLL